MKEELNDRLKFFFFNQYRLKKMETFNDEFWNGQGDWRSPEAAEEGETSPEVKSCIPEEGCCRGKMAGRHMVRVTLHIANNLFNPA